MSYYIYDRKCRDALVAVFATLDAVEDYLKQFTTCYAIGERTTPAMSADY